MGGGRATIPGSVQEMSACGTECCGLVDMMVFGQRLDSSGRSFAIFMILRFHIRRGHQAIFGTSLKQADQPHSPSVLPKMHKGSKNILHLIHVIATALYI